MSWRFSARSLTRLHTVEPLLQALAHRALALSSIDFGIPQYGGRRSADEQNHLFEAKLSRADGVTVLSNHQSGEALDFFAYVDGQASWKKEHLSIVACAFLQAACEEGIALEWGGHWRGFVDFPHVQLAERTYKGPEVKPCPD